MRFRALATDYDGTLTSHRQLTGDVVSALKRLRDSGRKVILVTGRALPVLLEDCSDLTPFDLLVLENGALLVDPVTRTETLVSRPLPQELVQRFIDEKFAPSTVGKALVATLTSEKNRVEELLKPFRNEAHIITNKHSLMVLPTGIDKGTGMLAALRHLGIRRQETVGIGDAENDVPFLSQCGAGIAIGAATSEAIAAARLSIPGVCEAGAIQVCESLIASDLKTLLP